MQSLCKDIELGLFILFNTRYDNISKLIIDSMINMPGWMQHSFWCLILSYVRSLKQEIKDVLFVNLLKHIQSKKEEYYHHHIDNDNDRNVIVWMTSEAMNGITDWANYVYASKERIFEIYQQLLSFPIRFSQSNIQSSSSKGMSLLFLF